MKSTLLEAEKNLEAAVESLIAIGKCAYDKAWVPATSGNFSARLYDDYLAITVSGKHKGYLTQSDIMMVDGLGLPLDDRKPSAETALHTSLYQWDRDINTVLHTHSVRSTVLSLVAGNQLLLNGLEVLKAFKGINSHESEVVIPVFDNNQDMTKLSGQVAEYLNRNSAVPGYLIKGHGLYTWGRDIDEAMRHLEAFEFLFECELEMRRLK